MLRFSLRTLAAAVAAIALACGALINANVWIASTAWTLVFLILSLATVAALLQTSRGFWVGFAAIGWLYVLAVMGPLSGRLDGLLLTTTALNRAAAAMPQAKAAGQTQAPTNSTFIALSGVGGTLQTTGTSLWSLGPTQPINQDNGFVQTFVQIGQAFWTMLLAMLGGLIGRFVVSTNETGNRAAPTAGIG